MLLSLKISTRMANILVCPWMVRSSEDVELARLIQEQGVMLSVFVGSLITLN